MSSNANCDALALLIVRLESGTPSAGELCWHRWDQATGAETHGLPAGIDRNSTSEAPFKRLPREGGWAYFNPHVERVLFPPGNENGGRWLCCPDDVYVDFAAEAGGPVRRARIDLLERIGGPPGLDSPLGLVHLTLLPADRRDSPDTLAWARAITSLFRHPYDRSELELRREGGRTDLAVRNPVRALAESLFGDPHPQLERSLYTVLMAQCPPDCRADVEREADWRRALARRRLAAKPANPGDPGEAAREARQTIRLAGATGLFAGRCAAFTLPDAVDGEYARNLRSYWAESIVFGLMQRNSLEEFQRRLAAIGDPLNPRVQPLRRDWLRFRNALWWSQLSDNTDIPQELLARLRTELGTEGFFADLEGDLATYSEQQQAAALANLQIFGAFFVVFGTLITAIGLFEPTHAELAALTAVSLLIALAAMLQVRSRLNTE